MQYEVLKDMLKGTSLTKVRISAIKWLAKIMRDYNINYIPEVPKGYDFSTKPFGYTIDFSLLDEKLLDEVNFGLIAWIAYYFDISLEEVEEIWRQQNTNESRIVV